DSRVWGYLLAYNVDPDRRLPLELSSPLESRHRYILRAPAGFEFDGLPRPRLVRSKWGSFSRTVAWLGKDWRGLRIDFTFRLDRTRIDVADFDAFRAFHKDVSDAYRVWTTVERNWDRKHLPELELNAALMPDDVTSAVL